MRTRLRPAAIILIVFGLIAALALAWQFVHDDSVTVARIVDGDTIVVSEDGEEVKVRLLNIDSPEEGECLHDEASARITELIPPGSAVTLQRDQEHHDRYGRDLAGVFTTDGTFVNEVMVAEGYARAVEFQPNVKFSSRMEAAELQARNAGLGVHAVTTDCLLPTDVAREALNRFQETRDPFYKDVMRDAVTNRGKFTYREQALEMIDSL